ncbi:unnamed protein product [Ambrosiozyma monospora]|uniref:Unnamed protein product n=1 Tax=Ambrosiozyma monospora TaxID=43982 RepID=A0ACB5T4P2_AMBMO|nr:unnamed protein product [Ambrosiozyma monospora]
MDTYGTSPGLLEIEYFDEAGTGLGPTLEFYANVSKEFSKSRVHMWRDNKKFNYATSKFESDDDSDTDSAQPYVDNQYGLFPRPLTPLTPYYEKIIHGFSVLGKFVARSLLDSRIIDFNFNPLFFQLSSELQNGIPLSTRRSALIERLKLVDPALANSLIHLSKYESKYPGLTPEERERVEVDGCKLSDLSLNFVLPGYPEVRIKTNGENVDITHENLSDYIDTVIDFTIGTGIKAQIDSFLEGFSKVFPFLSMTVFSSSEIVRLLGNEEEDWSYETLLNAVHADHGYSSESPSIQNLLTIMSEFDKKERRMFLQFLTGSPKLPIGGFKSLQPDLTVVLKRPEDDLQSDDYLPSVMTCANYLKLPSYSSIEVMREKLRKAMNEGANAFLLS